MTISLKHAYINPVADEGNPNETGPDEWNAEHVLTQAADRLLGRLSTSGATQELTAAQINTFLGTTGSAAHPAVSTDDAIARYDGLVGALQNSSATISDAGTLAINPTAASTTQGLIITQTGPSSGSSGADVVYNSVTVSNDAIDTTGFGTFCFYSVFNTGGANAKGQKYAIRGLANLAYSGSTTGGDIVGTSGWAISNQQNGGTNTGAGAAGSLYGMEAIGHAFSGATNYLVVSGGEVNASVDSGATTKHRWAWSLVGNGAVRGVSTDAALHIGAVTAAGAHTNAILLSNTNGFAPVPTGGTVLGTDGSANTITTGIDLSSYTISGNFLKGPSAFSVTGAGSMGLGIAPDAKLTVSNNSAATTAPVSGNVMHVVGATTGNILIDSFGGVASYIARRANGTAGGSESAILTGQNLFIFEGYGFGATVYSAASRFRIAAESTENWTDTAQGVRIAFFTTPTGGTATVAGMRLQASGGLSIGNASDPGLGMIYTNNVNFMIRSVATYNNGAAAGAGTITNAPAAGNPTKWIPVDDNGTTRYVPAW